MLSYCWFSELCRCGLKYATGCRADQATCPNTSTSRLHGHLVVVHKEVLEMNPKECTLTVSDLNANSMRVTAVHRFDSKGQPLKSPGR
jgi:hypothetical protein